MKISEITRTLEEWGLRVADDQILRPTAETVVQVYLLFLQLLAGITPEMLETPGSKALTVIEDNTVCINYSLSFKFYRRHSDHVFRNCTRTA